MLSIFKNKRGSESEFKRSKGFTIIELMVSIAIFAVMTALVMAKYGSFNQVTLVTNMAYDMALTLRTAQTYGISVKSVSGNDNYNSAYGVHFDISKNAAYVFFSDNDRNGVYNKSSTPPDADITTYNLTQGGTISSICLTNNYSQTCNTANGDTELGPNDVLDITFRRPNPDAYFYLTTGGNVTREDTTYQMVLINITSSDRSNTQTVVVRSTGQISVGE